MKIFSPQTAFSHVENEIIHAINRDPLTFLNHNLVDYGKKISCSKSAISRLVKLLNFSSLHQMKLFVQQQLLLHNFYYDINQNQTISWRINNIKSYNNFAINKTIEAIDLHNLQQIVNQLAQAARFHIFGVGSSYLAAYELTNNLLKINFSVSCSQDIHNTILVLANWSTNDFLILFSKSATTKEIAFLITTARQRGIKLLVITANEALTSQPDCWVIHHKDLQKDFRIIATSSKVCQLMIGDILFYELFFQNPNNVKQIENTFVELKKWKNYK